MDVADNPAWKTRAIITEICHGTLSQLFLSPEATTTNVFSISSTSPQRPCPSLSGEGVFLAFHVLVQDNRLIFFLGLNWLSGPFRK